MMQPDNLITIAFGILGLLIGSLLNVVIVRLPMMLFSTWEKECKALLAEPVELTPSINLFFPRSFCPHCRCKIRAWHNIPLLSFLWLKGRCYDCKTPISIQYPLVELLTCLLSLMIYWYFGLNLTSVAALLFLWFIIPMCLIDLKHQILPDVLTLSLLWLGLIANTQNLFTTLSIAVFSAAGGYILLWLFIHLFYLITGKIGMGHGDFKLFAAFGAWFGWTKLPFILLSSALTGAIIGIIYLKINQKSTATPIPFGPFLCFSGLITLFYGEAIWQYYLTSFIY